MQSEILQYLTEEYGFTNGEIFEMCPDSPEDIFMLKDLLDSIKLLFRKESIVWWFRKPNPAFDGQTPIRVIAGRGIGLVWDMVEDLKSGNPT